MELELLLLEASLNVMHKREIVPPKHLWKCNFSFNFRFYGIQNVNVDYYFKNQWIEYQKKNLLAVKIAESRRNPE